MSPAAIETPERSASKHDKKAKKEKKHKSEKKRAREDEDAAAEAEAERRPKKSKSEVDEEESRDVHDLEPMNGDSSVKAKKKKSKKVKEEVEMKEEETAAPAEEQDVEEPKSEKKKSKKKKKRDDEQSQGNDGGAVEAEEEQAPESTKTKKKKSKKHSEHAELLQDTPSKPPRSSAPRARDANADADAMELDEEPAPAAASDAYQPPDMPAKPQFPFFTQTVSLYEPIYPQGWSQPVTNCQYQHLRHLKNRYVPSLHGVLLDYRNVALGDAPGRAGAARTDEDATVLKSVNEYAVGFGWITADVDLFVPSRGAWMEGSVNLQTEGHIGVVCFGKFNASIEARRLPPAWKWVSNEDPEAAGMEETASVFTADDHGVTRQIHSTGFWVDGAGDKVKGKIRFRIRNFDVGISGDTSYLSLEGTMLDRDAEKKLVKEEALLAEQRKGKKGGRRVLHRRRAPEFAMTRFADDEGEGEGEGAEGQTTTTSTAAA
ncbi:DNA-directed RNA polymerase I subunit RPA43 [Escovopsis weberi]|uniref:DNA-directed RNA polymerase subunit n=1 Tax=Escovopsis weberi TaxID=150374 RepID=A0A0M8N469_ESCWE|nr:DNA-directed RNA polymerase I subunit RPA43 [Escovopsis weberi]